jgi:hypothetical protein
LLDRYLAPDDLAASAWYSFAIGAILAIGAFITQSLGPSSFQHRSLPRSIALRSIIFLYVFASIAFWRGVWLLQDVYLLPSQPELSSWVSVAIGTFVLLLLNSLRTAQAAPFFTAADGAAMMSWQLTTWYQEQGLDPPHRASDSDGAVA